MRDFKAPHTGEVFGPPRVSYDDLTLEELERLMNDVAHIGAGQTDDLSRVDWSEPESLGEELPAVPLFDADLLPASLRPMVEDVADRMQVPLDFPAVVAVAMLAGLCGRRAMIQPKQNDSSWKVVPNLWGGIVAPPGMMKSPVIACVAATAHAIEREWRTNYEVAAREYEAAAERTKLDNEAWAANYRQATKKGLTLPPKPQTEVVVPVQRTLMAADATYEALQKILSENPAGVLLLRDELSGWLAGLERQGREPERAFYLETWSGDSGFSMHRIGRGNTYAEHCCVSLFGGIQPAKLRGYLADALRDGPTNDGLIQRFQLLVWPDISPRWSYRDRKPDEAAMRAAEKLYRRIAAMDEDKPLLLKFAPDAQGLFVQWISDLETRLRAEGVSQFMHAHLSKYRSLMPSLALLFSLADGDVEIVGLPHAQQAAAWCDYLEGHAHRVYASRISPGKQAAISLGNKFSKGWKLESRKVTVRDVYQNDWSGLGTPEEARAALRVLEYAGWVRSDETKSANGRPSEVYAINPLIGSVAL